MTLLLNINYATWIVVASIVGIVSLAGTAAERLRPLRRVAARSIHPRS